MTATNERRRRYDGFLSITLVVGLATIVICEVFLSVDVLARAGAIVPYQEIGTPEGPLQVIARWVAVNLTPICWVCILFVLDGLLDRLSQRNVARWTAGGSPLRERPKRFLLCFLASIPFWLFFDWINFSYLGAWEYHGLPENFVHRYVGYIFAFGTISPAMFLFGELYLRLGLREVSGPRLQLGDRGQLYLATVGLVFVAFPFIVRDPIGTLTVWLAWLFLLDPINHRLGASSLLGDWLAGRWGRTFALMGAGLTCGFLWEFWNYWAAAKWTYHLPFLGPLEDFRYFEMPVVGLLGFSTFALECWVIFQTVVFLGQRFGLANVEPMPDDNSLL